MWHKTAVIAMSILILGSVAYAGVLSGFVTATGKRSNADAVVFIDEIPGEEFSPPTKHETMDQVRMVFTPHVLPVLVGTTVDFLNSDPAPHNVFTVDDCADRFDLGSWTKGETRSRTFDRPCAAVILCNVHPEMEAYVVAVPTPFFAVTDDRGEFKINDIPNGTYSVRVWHPTLKELSQKVTIAGETTLEVALNR